MPTVPKVISIRHFASVGKVCAFIPIMAPDISSWPKSISNAKCSIGQSRSLKKQSLSMAKIPDSFVWTGLPSAFERAGFVEVARRSPARPIMRVPG